MRADEIRFTPEEGRSENTVRFHVKNLYAKLGARTRLEALETARGLGLL